MSEPKPMTATEVMHRRHEVERAHRIVNPPLVLPREWVNRWYSARRFISDQQIALFRLLREPDALVPLSLSGDVGVVMAKETTIGLVWTKDDGPAGTVINAKTGAVYFDGHLIAADFEEAIALFRKRAKRLEYGVDPPPELYEARKREDRNRRRARSRKRSAGVKPPVASGPSEMVAAGEKPVASAPEEKDFMEMIRDMVGPRN